MKISQVIYAMQVLETIKKDCEGRDNCHKCPYQATICLPGGTDLIPECWDLDTLKHKMINGGSNNGKI